MIVGLEIAGFYVIGIAPKSLDDVHSAFFFTQVVGIPVTFTRASYLYYLAKGLRNQVGFATERVVRLATFFAPVLLWTAVHFYSALETYSGEFPYLVFMSVAYVAYEAIVYGLLVKQSVKN